ncbi:alkB, alkylation repair 4 [Cichlidogyrus casuarinus]|uniref:AlkB, alkylation repair 4 n=1 Tax=Cichlidogyrus casuarinus TaxID=1844966 RepID=A0ABD2QLX2_9PLAT
MDNFTGLPTYSKSLVDRINELDRFAKSKFLPVELCNLEYCPIRGSCIIAHHDDFWIWGENLITLNLCSDTYLTFTLPNSNDNSSIVELFLSSAQCTSAKIRVKVLLPRKSLVIVCGSARYIWLHEILREDIKEKRVAMTFRELSPKFHPNHEQGEMEEKEIGQNLLRIAL